MINEALFYIKQDRALYNYLKYNSHWYKFINRDPYMLNKLIDEMKTNMKITTVNKLKDLENKIEFISSILEIMK